MSHLFRWILFIALIMSGTVSAGAQTLKVAFSQDNMANDWRRAQVMELQETLAQEKGIHFFHKDAAGSIPLQVRQIEELIQEGIDVLVVSPPDPKIFVPVLRKAMRKGIKVILLTRNIKSDDYTSFISTDDANIATEAAKYFAKRFQGKKGRILMIQGLKSASTAILRSEHFLKEAKKHPHLSVVATKEGKYLRIGGIQAVSETIQQKIPFNAIYAQSDSMAYGAILALKKHGLDPRDFVILGIDYISSAKEAIRKGEQAATFTYPTCAKQAAQVILLLKQGKHPPKHIIAKSKLITKANLHQVEPIF